MFHHTTHSTLQQATSLLTTYFHLPRYDHSSHPTPSVPSPPAQTSSSLHRLHRQHLSPHLVGTFHPGPYTGKTHPDEHLKVYITNVALYVSQDAVFCKAFPTTLKGPVLEWFTTLPPYSIDNFDVLSHMFSTHFAGSHPHQTTTISLLGIRQEQGEPLRAFIDRFSKATLRNDEFQAHCRPPK